MAFLRPYTQELRRLLREDKEEALLAIHTAYARLCGIDGLGVDETEKGEVVMDGSFHSTSVKQGQVLLKR